MVARNILPEDTHVSREFRTLVDQAIQQLPPEAVVLEVGGVDRPLLSDTGRAFVYHGLDVDRDGHSCDCYDEFHHQSVTDPIGGKYDLIFSKFLLEHVDDNKSAVRQMSECLKPGGKMVHLVPCGYHPYSLATRLVGNPLQRRLIGLLRPSVAHTGYAVEFDCCTPGGFRRLYDGNEMEQVVCNSHWGASRYFEWFVPMFLLIKLFNFTAKILRLNLLASNIVIAGVKKAPSEELHPDMN